MEKMAFEWSKSFFGATTNLDQQQNLFMTNGIMFVPL